MNMAIWQRSILIGCVVVAGGLAMADDIRTRDDAAWGTPGGSPGTQMAFLNPVPHRPGAYRLGINVQNSPVGVQVIEVGPTSLAKSAGLEVGDTIVAVGGYQVGFVGERLFDLGDEIARRVDPSESVTLLIRSARSSALANVPVRFASATRAVSGRLLSDGRARLPASGVVIVRVLDVTYPQWQDVAVAQTQLPAAAFPMTYRVELPALTAGHRYAVDARGEHGGRIVMQSGQPTPLASVDRDQQVDLVLTPAGTASGTLTPMPPTGSSGLVSVNARPSPSLQPRDQIDQWIRSYLGRPPRAFETEVWQAELMRGRSLTSVQAGILSSSELFERASRSADLYVSEVYRLLTGSQPTPAQFADLRARYDQSLGVRLPFVEGLLQPPR
jgi:uncharacterized lipoprotein YbaY